MTDATIGPTTRHDDGILSLLDASTQKLLTVGLRLALTATTATVIVAAAPDDAFDHAEHLIFDDPATIAALTAVLAAGQ